MNNDTQLDMFEQHDETWHTPEDALVEHDETWLGPVGRLVDDAGNYLSEDPEDFFVMPTERTMDFDSKVTVIDKDGYKVLSVTEHYVPVYIKSSTGAEGRQTDTIYSSLIEAEEGMFNVSITKEEYSALKAQFYDKYNNSSTLFTELANTRCAPGFSWFKTSHDEPAFQLITEHFPDSAFHDSFIRILGRLALTKDTVVLQALVNTMRDIEAETVQKAVDSIITNYYKAEMKGQYRAWLSERMFLPTSMEREAREERAMYRKLSTGRPMNDRRCRSSVPSEQTIGLWQREQNEHITVLVAKVRESLFAVSGERWLWYQLDRMDAIDSCWGSDKKDLKVKAKIITSEIDMQLKRYNVVPLPYVLEKLHMLSQAD